VRVPTRHGAPRALLEAVMPSPGLELFWRRERTHPVGSGALQFTNPHIADHLTYSRLADLAQTGARLAITEDPGSLYQLGRHAERFNVRVQGLYELLAEYTVPKT
jgi:Fe-S oxidoreductase